MLNRVRRRPCPLCLGHGVAAVWLSNYGEQHLECSFDMVGRNLSVLVAIVSLCICWSRLRQLLAILARLLAMLVFRVLLV
jgi:hypothetical protein